MDWERIANAAAAMLRLAAGRRPVAGRLDLNVESMALPSEPGLTLNVDTAAPDRPAADGLKMRGHPGPDRHRREASRSADQAGGNAITCNGSPCRTPQSALAVASLCRPNEPAALATICGFTQPFRTARLDAETSSTAPGGRDDAAHRGSTTPVPRTSRFALVVGGQPGPAKKYETVTVQANGMSAWETTTRSTQRLMS